MSKKEMYVTEDVGIYQENGTTTIQLVDKFFELDSFDWNLFKPILLEIIRKSLEHKRKKGYIHSNEIDEIVFKTLI